MVSRTINKKILKKIMSNPKVKGMKLQSVRDAISKIHKDNYGITINAAAYVFAKRKGFSIYRYLEDDDDKRSLQYLRPQAIPFQVHKKLRRTGIKVKEVTLSFGKKYIKEANENASIYPYIYVLENSLRELILEKYKDEKDWWNNDKFVKQEIRGYAKRIRDAEKKHRWLGKGRGDHPIYYIGLYHLFKIIEKNFNPYFKNVFDLGNLRTWINESVPIRNLVAHNIKTEREERENIRIRAKYICNLIEKNMLE